MGKFNWKGKQDAIEQHFWLIFMRHLLPIVLSSLSEHFLSVISLSTGYQFLISTIKASCEELYSSALEEEPKTEKKATPKEERMFFKEDESKIAQPKVDVVVEGEIKDKHAEEDEPSECVIC